MIRKVEHSSVDQLNLINALFCFVLTPLMRKNDPRQRFFWFGLIRLKSFFSSSSRVSSIFGFDVESIAPTRKNQRSRKAAKCKKCNFRRKTVFWEKKTFLDENLFETKSEWGLTFCRKNVGKRLKRESACACVCVCAHCAHDLHFCARACVCVSLCVHVCVTVCAQASSEIVQVSPICLSHNRICVSRGWIIMVVFPTPKLIQMFVPRAHERASAQIGYFNAVLEGWVRFPTQQYLGKL